MFVFRVSHSFPPCSAWRSKACPLVNVRCLGLDRISLTRRVRNMMGDNFQGGKYEKSVLGAHAAIRLFAVFYPVCASTDRYCGAACRRGSNLACRCTV